MKEFYVEIRVTGDDEDERYEDSFEIEAENFDDAATKVCNAIIRL